MPESSRPRWAGVIGAILLLVATFCFSAAPASASPNSSAFFDAGSQLDPCTSISSPSGRFVLQMQCDGNLVLRYPGNLPHWASDTAGGPGSVLQMQNDGNAVVYSAGHVARWATGTAGHPGARLALQDDGNLVVVAKGNIPIWASEPTLDFVPTPTIRRANHPFTFSPTAAATWAQRNESWPETLMQTDPCTEFVSSALAAAGLPQDTDWFDQLDPINRYMGLGRSDAWANATEFVDLMTKRGWLTITPIDLNDASTSARAVAPDGSIGGVGDLIYYEWNGVPSKTHVHLAIITGMSGSVALVTEQGGNGLHAAGVPWNWSYVSNQPLVQSYGTDARAFLLHWV
jgi:hypothetical protein